MTFRVLYESGELERVIDEKNPHIDNVLFALCFLCDDRFFFEKTKELVKTLDKKWIPRIALFRAVKSLNCGHFDIAEKRLNIFKEDTLIIGQLDSFYISLFRLLKKLISLKFDASVSQFSEDSCLIGDSHCISLSYVWQGDQRNICYLPGFALRGLSFPEVTSYSAALRNSVVFYQRRTKLVFTVGEIDARNNYLYADKILRNPNHKKQIFETIESGLTKVFSYKAPYQSYYLFALPGFNKNLIPEGQISSEAEIKELYLFFIETFQQTAEKIGFKVIDNKDILKNHHVENLIDHAHLHPSLYQEIIEGYSKLNP